MKKLLVSIMFIIGIFSIFAKNESSIIIPSVKTINSKISGLENIDWIQQAKTLKNNDILITYEDDKINSYYFIINSDLQLIRANEMPYNENCFYVKNNNILILDEDGYISEFNPYTKKIQKITKPIAMFNPHHVSYDKTFWKKEIWTTSSGYIGINTYEKDYSFWWRTKKIKLQEPFKIEFATNSIYNNNAFLLIRNKDNKHQLISYNYKWNTVEKDFFAFSEELDVNHEYEMTLSPDKKWLVFYPFISDENYTDKDCCFFFYDTKNEIIYKTSLDISLSGILTNIDWNFDSSSFIICNRDLKTIYKIFMPKILEDNLIVQYSCFSF